MDCTSGGFVCDCGRGSVCLSPGECQSKEDCACGKRMTIGEAQSAGICSECYWKAMDEADANAGE